MTKKNHDSSNDIYPPFLYNHEGLKRHVGFEIEYVGISIEKSIEVLNTLFPGDIKRLNQNEYHLQGTCFGQFKVVLDAHVLQELAAQSEKNKNENKFDMEGYIQRFISSTLDEVIPLEIVTPPVPIQSIKSIDSIVEALREHGAKGTYASQVAAFGVHINPDLPSLSASCILNYMRAYVLLSDWLRSEIEIDFSRKVLPYINEYPKDYKTMILKPDYHPSINTLIEDYILFNHTRNRALDMLPLFMYIDEQTIQEKIGSKLIQSRPTLHYRLANSNLNLADWSFTTEWMRWLYVEKLAANEILQAELAAEYLSLNDQSIFFDKTQWINITMNYLKQL